MQKTQTIIVLNPAVYIWTTMISNLTPLIYLYQAFCGKIYQYALISCRNSSNIHYTVFLQYTTYNVFFSAVTWLWLEVWPKHVVSVDIWTHTKEPWPANCVLRVFLLKGEQVKKSPAFVYFARWELRSHSSFAFDKQTTTHGQSLPVSRVARHTRCGTAITLPRWEFAQCNLVWIFTR
jgi:hypothetical protein